MPKTHNKLLGAQGEELATRFLIQLGYIIIERNWRTRYGEIDIIVKKANTLYCVEVKTRTNLSYGYPIDAITPKKIQRMQLTAHMYAAYTHYTGPLELIIAEVIGNQCSLRKV